MPIVREAAVAGRFYPGRADELGTEVRQYLKDAANMQGPAPKAMIAPHAGYLYSGPIAASAYARLAPFRERFTRVVLLGPCHTVPLHGIAASGADSFRTPLGDVPLDRAAIATLDVPAVQLSDHAHEDEHSLEVHLPFLQHVLERFSLVPLVIGDASPGAVAQTIDSLWGGPETMIVVSSDLSHYLDYDSACRIDRATCDAIEQLDGDRIQPGGACGRVPVSALLLVARRRGMTVETLDLRNSGDTAGAKNEVVGYGSWLLFEPSAQITARASRRCRR